MKRKLQLILRSPHKVFICLLMFFVLLYPHITNAQCTNNTVRPSDGYIPQAWWPTCNNGTDGEIRITNIQSTLGVGNYTNQQYSVRLLSGPGAPATIPIPLNTPTFTVTGLSPGTYLIDIIDQCGGNSADKSVTIANPPTPLVTAVTGLAINDNYSQAPGCGNYVIVRARFQIAWTSPIGTVEFTFTNNLGATMVITKTYAELGMAETQSTVATVNAYLDIPKSFFNSGSISLSIKDICGQIKPGGTISIGSPDITSGVNTNLQSGCATGFNPSFSRFNLTNPLTFEIEETANPGVLPNNYLGAPMTSPQTLNIAHYTLSVAVHTTVNFGGLNYNTDYTVKVTDACGIVKYLSVRQNTTAFDTTFYCGAFSSGTFNNAGVIAINPPVSSAGAVYPLSVVINSGPTSYTSSSGTGPVVTSTCPIVYPITCNPITLAVSQALRPLGISGVDNAFVPGTYNITVTDACGKTFTKNYTLTCSLNFQPVVSIAPCAPIGATIPFSIALNAYTNYGNAPKYSIYDASGTVVLTGNTVVSPPFTLNASLPNGSYTFRYGGVKADGTLQTAHYQIAASCLPRLTGGFLYEYDFVINLLPLSFATVNACLTSLTAMGSGGTLPYTYAIYDATGTTLLQPYQVSGGFTGLTTGTTYQIRVKDSCGREFAQTFTTGTPLTPMIGNVIQPACPSTPTGQIEISGLPSGNWIIKQNDGSTNVLINGSGTIHTISGLVPGNYTFEVQDLTFNNGCFSPPTIPAITINPLPVCCLFAVTCPTFPVTTVECYGDLPSATTLTEAEFEALGNADGIIGDLPCGIIEITASNSADAGTCPQTVTRTYTITEYEDTNSNGVRDTGEDTVLNTQTCTQTITVQDTTAPAFVEALPVDAMVECSAVPTAPTLTATDNCGTATVTYNEVRTDGLCPNNYSLARTWTATDVCGNVVSHTQTITVDDTTAPVFVEALPADATVECDAVPIAPILTATDNCGTATVSYTETTTAGSCAGSYTLTRTWIATDLCGLATTHVQTITVQDTTAPTFVEALPANVTVECSAVPTAVVLTATDNCGTATVAYTQTTTAGSCAGSYTLTRTWIATDLCGLTTTHVQTITVQDTTAPTFVEALPANVTVECSAVPTAPTLTATDNCGTATVAYTQTTTAGFCAGSYTLTRTWIATDLCGLTTTHVQTITVQDTTAPTFVEALPANATVECSAVPTAVVLTATDNCGTATVAYSQTTTAGFCAGSYTLTRTWTATDLCGLTTTHVQTITVQDTTPPTFVEALPANVTVECSAVPTAVVLTATDNCGTATVAYTETTTAGSCAGSYTLTRTWTATDLCGLTTTHVQTITVQDTTAPTFVEALPANVTVECSAVPTAVVLTATDNCGTATVAYTETTTAGSCAGSYTLTRTWTATDLCGLTTTHVQTITVQDTTAPTFVEALPANVTVECSAVPTAVVLTATDNCGTATVAYSQTTTAGFCAGSYTLTRTWIATDLCGLTTTHVQTITVQDTTAPTFVEALPANVTVECSAVPTAVVLTATDNCGTATVAYSQTTTAGSCAGSYTLTRTWIATDLCGLTTTHVQTITVQDTTAPTFVEALPANATVECSAVPTAPTLTATDNCGTATVAYSQTTTASSCAGSYTLTRTWIATDLCGLTTTHVQTITVQDTTAPTFVETLPTNITVECSAVPTAPTLTATDNCGTATVAYTETTTAGSCAGSYTLTRTWIATDLCGLTTTHVQTITVQDTTAPTFVETLPTNITVECSAVPTAPTLTATDNCGTATVAYTETTTAGSCAGSYTLTRTWIATDLCGLTTTHVQTITVQDTTAPAFVEALPVDAMVECSAVPTAPTLTATDNCGTATVAYTETTTAGFCAGSYTLTRTWIATDLCGLTTTHVQTITVQDTTAPTFVEALPTNVTVECSAVPTAPTLTATDNCGTATVAYSQTTTAGSCAGSYTLTRTWIATDACGLATTHVQTITVQDTTPPTFVETLPTNVTVECSAVPTAPTLTATDNCGTATVAYTETTTAGSCAGSYTLTRTWIATDACGLATTHVQTITVQDTTAPTFVETLPTNVTVECSAVPTAPTLTATDNCGTATVAYTETTTAGSCAGSYTLTRTWTATDLCGLATTHVQTITVQDTTAPTFVETLPTNITVECSAVPTAVVLTATDNCGTATVAYTETTTAGSCAGSYTLTRTWTATDLCGLATTHVQTITVQDTTAPTFVETLPTNITVECSAVPTAVVLTATDNCGTATVAYTETTTAGSCAGSYTLTRTWTATDLCGLATTHVQTITVQDTTAPTFVEALPANVTVECSAVPTAVVLTATDNCGTATVAYSQTTTAGSCAGSYTLTRTWIATDLCGLTTTHVQTITVQDTTAPTFVEALPANVTVECSAVPTAVVLTATDNCGTATVAYSQTTTAGFCAGSYTLTRTWIATDLCGLTTTHVQTITVQDTTAPTFVEALPANVTVECSAVPTAVVLTATDNCGTATVAYSQTTTAGSCAGSYTLTRTWIATDLCGLTTTHVQTITVQDTTAPTFVEALPANVTVECSAVPTAVVLTATDNCGTATVAYSQTTTAGFCAGSYTLTRTWIATDLCGLTTTHVQTITVQDTTAPTFVEALPANVTVECSAVPTAVVLTATDNCGTATVAYSQTTTAGSCAGSYTLTRTWIATDLCGLTTTHVQTITVQDTTAPVLTSTLDTVINVNCDAIPDMPVLVFSDACSTASDITITSTETPSEVSENGSYTIIRTWTAFDSCNNQTTVSQTVNVTISNFFRTTTVDEVCNIDIDLVIDLTQVINAQFPGVISSTGTFVDVSGVGTALSGGIFTPLDLADGDYIVRYENNDADCPRIIEVTIPVRRDVCTVKDCVTLIIHNAFSPDDDGINENFIIDNITNPCYAENTVEIYNRWGVLVYEVQNYNNEDRVFKGYSNGRTTVKETSGLPTGTYFYVLKYKNIEGNYSSETGWVYLGRSN